MGGIILTLHWCHPPRRKFKTCSACHSCSSSVWMRRCYWRVSASLFRLLIQSVQTSSVWLGPGAAIMLPQVVVTRILYLRRNRKSRDLHLGAVSSCLAIQVFSSYLKFLFSSRLLWCVDTSNYIRHCLRHAFAIAAAVISWEQVLAVATFIFKRIKNLQAGVKTDIDL